MGRFDKDCHEQSRRDTVARDMPDWSNSFVTSNSSDDRPKGVDKQGGK